MDRTRRELMPGVWLTHLRTDKFKTGALSVTLLSQLSRESAAMNACIPSVLRRGTVSLPDMDAIAERLSSLYGAAVAPVVRRIGEVQAWGFAATFADDRFLPEGGHVLEDMTALTGDLLLSPNTRGGLLLPDYVQSEKQKLVERIQGRMNDKGTYAMQRLIEEMCVCEDFAVGRLGDEESAEAIYYTRLTKHYRERLAVSPVEIFYCGSAPAERVEDAVIAALGRLPRGELDYDIGTDIRMNSLEAQPRYITEELDVTQGKLAMGWRLGECMEDPDAAAIRVFNAVFGGCLTSKLFVNVRERLSLCYYASSGVDLCKGLLLVTSGVDFDKYEAARDEIFAQLEAIRRGEITAEELASAIKSEQNSLRSTEDDAMALEGWWLSHNLTGEESSPEELSELCGEVTAEDVAAIARSVECDAVYFLRGGETENDGE